MGQRQTKRILNHCKTQNLAGESICAVDGRLPNGRQGQDDGQLRLRLGGEVYSGLPLHATPGKATRHQPAHA